MVSHFAGGILLFRATLEFKPYNLGVVMKPGMFAI